MIMKQGGLLGVSWGGFRAAALCEKGTCSASSFNKGVSKMATGLRKCSFVPFLVGPIVLVFWRSSGVPKSLAE